MYLKKYNNCCFVEACCVRAEMESNFHGFFYPQISRIIRISTDYLHRKLEGAGASFQFLPRQRVYREILHLTSSVREQLEASL